MRPSRAPKDDRRRIFLALVSSVERQLRDLYAERHDAGETTQAALAAKLDIGRSAVHRRLNGETNMTLKTVADMVWALSGCVEVDIFDPADRPDRNDLVRVREPVAVAAEPSAGAMTSCTVVVPAEPKVATAPPAGASNLNRVLGFVTS